MLSETRVGAKGFDVRKRDSEFISTVLKNHGSLKGEDLATVENSASCTYIKYWCGHSSMIQAGVQESGHAV